MGSLAQRSNGFAARTGLCQSGPLAAVGSCRLIVSWIQRCATRGCFEVCLKSQVRTVLSLVMLVPLCSCLDAVVVLSQAIRMPQITQAEPVMIACTGT